MAQKPLSLPQCVPLVSDRSQGSAISRLPLRFCPQWESQGLKDATGRTEVAKETG